MDSRISTPQALFILLWLSLSSFSAAGQFTSIQAFGDGVSTTTDNISATAKHGNRFCNGRVWVEVLAEWQGLTYDESANNSYFGHYSLDLITSTTDFSPPSDVATSLAIVWVNNADLVGQLFSTAGSLPYDSSDLPAWNTFIADAVSNHETAITTLYNKGVRTIVTPDAVDVTLTPRFPWIDATSKAFVRERVLAFNAALETAYNGLTGTLTGLTIHHPDTFAFIDDVMTNPAAYGVGNPTLYAFLDEPVLDGPGADYVWWDQTHPTAKVQMHLAALVQQEITPITVTSLSLSSGDTFLSLENIPLERNGFVEGRTGPGLWQEDSTIFESFAAGSSNTTISFPTPSSTRLQRVHFPVDWSWP